MSEIGVSEVAEMRVFTSTPVLMCMPYRQLLGVRGETVLDPFGGTGQTALEAVKYGCSAITADVNTIATMTASARLTYMSRQLRDRLRATSLESVLSHEPVAAPAIPDIRRWFDAATLMELGCLKAMVDSEGDEVARGFLLANFSAILNSASSRRGKQHNYFADNTPLRRGLDNPPYVDAVTLFLAKLQQNLDQVERLFGSLERDERDPAVELSRVSVLRADATNRDGGLNEIPRKSVAAIVTSPPYLCMADYALGNRLSYYWLAPEAMLQDYMLELGARRQRFTPEAASLAYYKRMRDFGENAESLLIDGGHLAMVLGAPVAKAFQGEDVLSKVDMELEAVGLRLVWSAWRTISWHRNHGVQRLNSERVSVYGRV